MDPLGYFTRTNVYKHCKEFEIHPRSQIAVLAPQEAAPIRDFRADSPASTKWRITARLQPLRKGFQTPLSVRWFPCESYYCSLGFLEKKTFHLPSISLDFEGISRVLVPLSVLDSTALVFLWLSPERDRYERLQKRMVKIYEFSGESRGICHQPKVASLPLKLLQTFAISTASNVTISYQFYAFRDSVMFFFELVHTFFG